MSLEARIELLTAAVIELTAAIGAMQAPGPVTPLTDSELPAGTVAKFEPHSAEWIAARDAAITAIRQAPDISHAAHSPHAEMLHDRLNERVPNGPPKSSPSGEQSAPTGESSSPVLDYVKDVKPITIRLSKEKGRETTIAVLQRFGVKSAQELDAAQWAEYIAHCEKVLAGGEV